MLGGLESISLHDEESAYWPPVVLGSGRTAQIMAAVDSEALFKAKCKQLKLPEDAIGKMTAKGWTTRGTFAFAVPGDPGKVSDSDFRSIVCQPVLGSEQEHVPKLRRLHFESFAITAAELKRTAEVQESDQPRKLPVVELAARYDDTMSYSSESSLFDWWTSWSRHKLWSTRRRTCWRSRGSSTSSGFVVPLERRK